MIDALPWLYFWGGTLLVLFILCCCYTAFAYCLAVLRQRRLDDADL